MKVRTVENYYPGNDSESLLDEIYNNIEKLGSLREKRLKYKSKAYEYPYYNMLQAVETYHNANFFKFYELYRSVISSINIHS